MHIENYFANKSGDFSDVRNIMIDLIRWSFL
jgi:hypothetical protein